MTGVQTCALPICESGAPAWIVPTAAGLLALTAVAWWGWRIDARGIHGLQQALVSRLRAGDRQGFASTLNTAVQLHPTEPSFALLAGAEASHRGDASALPWLTHAMRLAEGWDAPHIEAARYLAGRQQFSQAFLEAREAEMRRPESSTILVAQILDENPETLPELVRIAGTGVEGSSWLDRVATRLPFASRALPPLDHELVERGIVGARVRRARRLARVDAAAALEALEPIPEGTNAEVDLARARVLIDSGNADQAASLITDHLVRRARDPVAALRLRAEAHAVAGNAEAMRATMDMVRGRASGHAAQLSHAWIFQGHQERVLGHEGAAVRAFERAHRLAPSEASLVQVAVQAERVGDHGRAMRAYSELCRLAGNHGPHCDAEGRAREKMSERSPPPVQPHGAP